MFDFPIFDMPLVGHRLMFAFDAIVHVFISHGAAVGGSIILVLAQWFAIKNNDRKFDELAYKIFFTFFVLATAVGALTGIGIWIHVNIINPAAIGALLRVFFWKWFIEWIVFNLEMIFLLIWFLTWKARPLGTPGKKSHFKIGLYYAIASWLTMAIITAILGFMMTPGNWLASDFPTKPDYLASLMNPSWIPSLGFRTFFSVIWAASAAMMLSWFFTKQDEELRAQAMRFFGRILAACIIPMIVFGYWYYLQFPQAAKDLFTMGVITRRLIATPELATIVTVALALLSLASMLYLYFKPKKAAVWIALVMFIANAALISEFERVREFVRKPYIIYGYMYANGVRVQDMALLNKEGYLKNAAFVPEEYRNPTATTPPEIRIKTGEYLYQMQCRYCHTINGVNSVKARITNLGIQGNADALYQRIKGLNSAATPFMPPFAGTDEEMKALAAYLATLNAPPSQAAAAAKP
ncbi:MAG: c-type cytochrome [Thiothrix sp.]|uniref:c-type cytochrome n=1 Tax=Thiothrix sp. TaxID=1032 RepID=UPI00260AC44A|nr:c-type cytochrome [Thiothrix sp.]MDD5391956.1 c-type cytochrome [Thiothrix sp.]